MSIYPAALIYLVLGATALFLFREPGRSPPREATQYETALSAATLMKDWGVWMTTVSTAAIGTIGVLFAQSKGGALVWAELSVFLFGLSIVFAAWVLGSLPSVVLRLRRPPPAAPGIVPAAASPQNDIYEMKFFSFVPVRVGVVAALQHIFFVLGLYCFALFVTHVRWEVPLIPWFPSTPAEKATDNVTIVLAAAGWLVAGLTQWVSYVERKSVRKEEQLFKALGWFEGKTQRRSIGIAVVEGLWDELPSYRRTLIPLLANQAIYLLAESKEGTAHERNNLERIMRIVLGYSPLRDEFAHLHEELRALTSAPFDRLGATGQSIDRAKLEVWNASLG